MEVAIFGETRSFENKEEATAVVKSQAKVMPDVGASNMEAKARGVPRIVVKDGKRMQLVSEEFMSLIRLKPPNRPAVRQFSVEVLRDIGLDGDDLAVVLDGLQAARDIREIEKGLLEQHDATGHAYVELLEGANVEEDEEEEEV